ncbi:MAG: hypothetical protein AB1830_07395 [Pseudomonadota bacterium]
MKILAIVDRHGLPLSVSTPAANHHEVRLVQLSFDFYRIEAKPENLMGDRAYDSDKLDAPLEAGRHRDDRPASLGNRTLRKTQDGRRLRRYARRRNRGTLLRLDSMATSAPGSLGVLRRELPQLRSARLHGHPTQATLR